MSAELYEVLSLAARYLFALLGVVIVLRSYFWLLADRAEKHRRLRRLPDAGCIGELVVCMGNPDLPEGTSLPVPWEGELGAVRSCDIVVPCEGVRKRHLRFSFETGIGLRILPESGCEAFVDQVMLNCRSGEKGVPMAHGSFLQVGQALLQLRIFAGLDSSGIIDTPAGTQAAVFPGSPEEPLQPAPQNQTAGYPLPLQEPFPPESARQNMVPEEQDREWIGEEPQNGTYPVKKTGTVSVTQGPAPDGNPADSSGRRKRRSARWEEDWSE